MTFWQMRRRKAKRKADEREVLTVQKEAVEETPKKRSRKTKGGDE